MYQTYVVFRDASQGQSLAKRMSEASDLLSQFFAEKAISGDPITPEESEWIQSLLTPSQTEPSQQHNQHHFDDSQSVVYQGDPEPNCFLSQSTYGFSQPSTYDSQEVLRKYQHYYSASQDMQPSQLSKRIVSAPKTLLASLDSQRVLTPILETFKAKAIPLGPDLQGDKTAITQVLTSQGPTTTQVPPAAVSQPGLTNVASAIIQLLGDSSKEQKPTTDAKKESLTPAIISIPAFPMTPSPAAVVKPFIVDTPNDSEAFPKRIRTAEPEKPIVTPIKTFVTPITTREPVILPPSQPFTLDEPSPSPPVSLPVSLPVEELPVFEFHSPTSGKSQSDQNSLQREARQCSSGELPEFRTNGNGQFETQSQLALLTGGPNGKGTFVIGMSSNLLTVHEGNGGDPESMSEGSSELFDEETAILRSGSPGSAELLQESVKRWLALLIWLATLLPTILAALRVPLPEYFGIGLAVWARYGLTIIFIQAGVRLAIRMVIRWMRKADAEKLQSGSVESGSVDIASHLEAVSYPLTMLITTVVFAGVWYMVYPMGCPVVDVPLPPIDPSEAMSIPIVDEETAAASILVNSIQGNTFSSMFTRIMGNMCIYQFITDLIICSVIINFFLILEIVVMRIGQWRFLRSNFQDRILESRYRTYVVESLRNRVSAIGLGLESPHHHVTSHGLPISFPFVLPFEVPLFDRLLRWLNDGILDTGPTSFDRMIMGRPLTYLEYKRKLTGWVERHGLDEAVDFVARTVPQSDGDSKAIAKELFGRLCSADRDYIIPNDFLSIFQGRAASRDAYGIFDRDQDGTVTKTEFRHTCIMVYREMRNLAVSVQHAGDAFCKLADSVHLLVVLGLTFVCLAIFGVHVQSLFAVALSLILGLNVLIGDVAKRSFQGIVFLFVDHPYDVGDRVLVSSLSEADPLQVHRINMLTTVFHRWNGQEVYAPNANLAMATIYNISRSAEQWERIDFQVALDDEKGQTDRIALFRDKLEAFLKTRGADYMAAYELKPVIAGEIGRAEQHLDQLTMTLRVQCRPTLDSQKRWSRHSKLLSFVRNTLPSCNLNLVGLKSID